MLKAITRTLCLSLGVTAAAFGAQATTIALDLDPGYVGDRARLDQRVDLTSILAEYDILALRVVAAVADDLDETIITTGDFGDYYRARTSFRPPVNGATQPTQINFNERERLQTLRRDGENGELVLQDRYYGANFGSTLIRREARAPITPNVCTSQTEVQILCYQSYERRISYYADLLSSTTNVVLPSRDLSQVIGDGYLDFSMRSGRGDFYVTNARVFLTLEALPAAPVPLPAGAVLLLSALGLAGVTAGARRKPRV